MTAWGMGYPDDSVENDIPCIAQRMCEKARLSYRHPERSRGIFFVGGQMENVWEREMGNTVSRKGGASPRRLSEGGGKGGEKDFSLCSKWQRGEWISRWQRGENGYLRYRIKCSLGKHSSRIVIPGKPALKANYLFISIAHHAFLIIIYFSDLEYFLWIYLRRHAGNNRCKCISLYDLINSRLCKFRNSINSYVNAKQKWKWGDGTHHFNS